MAKSKKNKSKKTPSKNGANKKAHNASNKRAGGGKFRRRNQEMADKSPPLSGMMQCYENALHTNSVALRHVPFMESALDKYIGAEPGSKEFVKVKKGKLKKLRKQTKTVVITRTNIGDIAGEHEQDAQIAGDALTIHAIFVKPLLVLDLNGILCRRIRYKKLHVSVKEGETINFRPSVGHIAGTPVVAREDLQPMLSYLDANFTLAVWTSAKLATARGLIAMLFPPDIASRLLFVWGQDRCDATRPHDTGIKDEGSAEDDASDEPADAGDGVGDSVGGKSNKKDNFDIIFEKSLSKVWAQYPIWDSTNTLLIDDSPEKARKWIENTLHPPPIDGVASEPSVESADLSNAIKQRIFFEKLVEHFGQGDIDDCSESIDSICSNLAVESTDDKRERKKRECKKLHSVLAEDTHMGWRGDVGE